MSDTSESETENTRDTGSIYHDGNDGDLSVDSSNESNSFISQDESGTDSELSFNITKNLGDKHIFLGCRGVRSWGKKKRFFIPTECLSTALIESISNSELCWNNNIHLNDYILFLFEIQLGCFFRPQVKIQLILPTLMERKHMPPMFTSHWNFEHWLDDFFGENNNITLRLNMPFQYQTYSLTEKSLSDFTSQQD